MGNRGLGPAFSGPLYLVLLFSTIAISYFLVSFKGYNYYDLTPPQVIGVSDVNASDTLHVTNVAAGVWNQKVSGCAIGQFGLWGEITSNGPGVVLYNWEGMDGASESIPLTFDTAETKYVDTSWQVYGAGTREVKLHVSSPNNIASTEIPFELECK